MSSPMTVEQFHEVTRDILGILDMCRIQTTAHFGVTSRVIVFDRDDCRGFSNYQIGRLLKLDCFGGITTVTDGRIGIVIRNII